MTEVKARYDRLELALKRMVCWARGHDDVMVINGLSPTGRRWRQSGGLVLAARINSTHQYCLRCKRRTPGARAAAPRP